MLMLKLWALECFRRTVRLQPEALECLLEALPHCPGALECLLLEVLPRVGEQPGYIRFGNGRGCSLEADAAAGDGAGTQNLHGKRKLGLW